MNMSKCAQPCRWLAAAVVLKYLWCGLVCVVCASHSNKFVTLPEPVLALSLLQELYMNGNPVSVCVCARVYLCCVCMGRLFVFVSVLCVRACGKCPRASRPLVTPPPAQLASLPESIDKLSSLVELSLQATKLKQLPMYGPTCVVCVAVAASVERAPRVCAERSLICGLKNLRCMDLRSGGKKELCKLQPMFSAAVHNCLVKGGVAVKAKKTMGKKGAGKAKRK